MVSCRVVVLAAVVSLTASSCFDLSKFVELSVDCPQARSKLPHKDWCSNSACQNMLAKVAKEKGKACSATEALVDKYAKVSTECHKAKKENFDIEAARRKATNAGVIDSKVISSEELKKKLLKKAAKQKTKVKPTTSSAPASSDESNDEDGYDEDGYDEDDENDFMFE
ncbi:hypothetical protein LEN26_020795 [Aphanomyces euteiches]|nr:hypothetical protein LEN26_020795 [Aphanomyces euteiches]KAH9124232.1 hypothetical protein AeMF1_004968 [Aphanomyces euteiches]KAH9191581.1 hypothetical protein AeNC1_006435 [Aphanomyces euteiches]